MNFWHICNDDGGCCGEEVKCGLFLGCGDDEMLVIAIVIIEIILMVAVYCAVRTVLHT